MNKKTAAIRNKVVLVILVVIVLTMIIVLTVPQETHADKESKKYTTYGGDKINQKAYDKRLLTCWTMKYEGLIKQNTDCDRWVLTYLGETLIAEYVIKKSLSDNPDLSLTDIIN